MYKLLYSSLLRFLHDIPMFDKFVIIDFLYFNQKITVNKKHYVMYV